jgi:FlaA1/EpsC-like NDP-sugar epimerase
MNSKEVTEIRCVVRDPGTVPSDHFPGDSRIKLLSGDVTDPESLTEVFKGAKVVFFAASGKGYTNCENTDKFGV